MKKLISVLAVLCLCSCASAPVMQSSINGRNFSSGPTSANDPRMLKPSFYMDDGGSGNEASHAGTPAVEYGWLVGK